MTDCEMLEAAAMAAGYVVDEMRSDGGAWCYPLGEQPDDDGDHPGLFVWNPLTDDGDALRLSVKLGISMTQEQALGLIYCDVVETRIAADEEYGADPYAATRRAIVRAAAEVGRA